MSNSSNYGGSDFSPEQRKRQVADIRVQYPVRAAVLELLEKALADSKHTAEPVCVFIGGPSGAGKSTLAELFEANHPEVKGGEVDLLPVLRTSLPSGSSRKDAASKILVKLGDARAFKGQLNDLTYRLLQYLRRREVNIAILDESQHLIDRESDKVIASTADWIKELIIESKIPFVLIGMPETARIFEVNPQLSRRFTRRMLIPPLGWAPDPGPNADPRPDEQMELLNFLGMVDQRLPFAELSGLDDEETAKWFHHHTGGVLGLVMRIVREAAYLAIDRGAKRLGQQDLKAALAQMTIDQKEIPVRKTRTRKGRGQRENIGEVLRA